MRNALLTQRARDMRKAMPEPEMRLWLQLRAARFRDVKFRRQKVIGGYIVDFAANDPKLVVELDGDTHAGQEPYDAARAAFLESKGYRVVRYPNNEVIGNLDGVLQHLSGVIEEVRARPPLPTLSPEGERAMDSLTAEGERAMDSLTPKGERAIGAQPSPSPLQGRGSGKGE